MRRGVGNQTNIQWMQKGEVLFNLTGARMGRKILLIDDEPTYCQHLALLLSGAGHEIRTATNRVDALRVGYEFLPDLLIADWALGDDQSGVEIAVALRRAQPKLRTLLITGNPDIAGPCDGRYAVVHEIISKPFNRACILAAVERLIALLAPLKAIPNL
jgi:DNA-binding response OmpR family regulator